MSLDDAAEVDLRVERDGATVVLHIEGEPPLVLSPDDAHRLGSALIVAAEDAAKVTQ